MGIARSCCLRRRDREDVAEITHCNLKRPSPKAESALLKMFRAALRMVDATREKEAC